MKQPQIGRLVGIEAIRGVAAVAVILYHCARHVAQAMPAPALVAITQCGHAGVDLFFVLSGFIICVVHAPDCGTPAALPRYVHRRVVRVMPLYWIALAAILAMAARHGIPPVPRLLASVALLPSDTPPLLGVAWTLQYQIVFYAVFAVLIYNLRVGLAVLALWVAWIAAHWAGVAATSLPRSLVSTYNFEFLFGMAAAYLIRTRKLPRPRILAALGLGVLAVMGVAEDFHAIDGNAALARLGYGLPSALLIAGVAEADRRGLWRVPPLLQQLGRASYSLYLFQFVFIGIVWQLLTHAGVANSAPAWALFAILAIAAVAGGIVVSRLVEHPLLALLRRRGARPALT